MLQKFYSTEALQQQMEQGEQQFLICFSEEQPAAFASYSEVEPNIYKLHKLYIILSQQGKGIGKFIIDYICNLLKEKNASHLRLNVNRYNSAAIAFYEKYGLKRIADEDIPIGAGYYMNDHVLEITLN
jgi:ribosomal protein S18 acetylase RimI-like enzyme